MDNYIKDGVDVYKLHLYPAPILSVYCDPIKEWDRRIHKSAQNASELLQKNVNAAAIAANQVGYAYRYFIYKDILNGGMSRIIINPEIIYEDKLKFGFEGCLSFPNMQNFIARYTVLQVKYISFPSLEEVVETITDPFLARVFQHEIEHLDGKFYYENLSEENQIAFLRRYRAQSKR